MTDNRLSDDSRPDHDHRLRLRTPRRRVVLTTTPTTPPSPDDLAEPLFERVSDTDHRCTRCGATNTRESDSFPSFGGTTDWWERCTSCDACISGCDTSAVL